MILTLVDAAERIAGFNIVDRNHIYCGKMEDKKDCSIGVYNLGSRRNKQIIIGGDKNSSYRIKPISVLIHWNKSTRDTELTAAAVYDALSKVRNIDVGNKRILFINMLVDTPVDVGTDDNGIYEMVIEADIYYERGKD